MINTHEYTTDVLESMPILAQGQAEDLRTEVELHDGSIGRIWMSRVGVDGGEPWEHTVTLEVRRNGRWHNVIRWDGDNPADFEVLE